VKKRLQDDLKTAMKAGDKPRLMAIRGLLAEVSLLESDARRQGNREATDDEIIQIIKRERARRAEAIDFAQKANRTDLVDQNEAEAKALAEYLPAGVSADEVRAAIAEIMAGGSNQMGPVMKGLREKFGARLDGKLASDLAKEALSKKAE
jgi:uncharacterized protein YqeY